MAGAGLVSGPQHGPVAGGTADAVLAGAVAAGYGGGVRWVTLTAGATVAALLSLPGCGSGSGATDLTVTVTLAEGVAPDVWSVTCGPAGGTHPDPEAACDFLATAQEGGLDPFAPVPDDVLCTQEYRGPATATVTGTWDGEPVDASYNLTNGCEIARWTLAEPLLGPLPAAN